MGSLRTYRVALVVALLLLLLIGVFVVKPGAPTYPPYVSASAQADGSKAVVLLMQEKDMRVREWRQPMKFLPPQEGQVLISLQPNGLGESEREELLDWVAAGNDLILFDDDPQDWEEASFYVHELEKGNEQRKIQGTHLAHDAVGVASTRARLEADPDMETLLYDEAGILAGRTLVGDGSVTLFLVPEWMSNGQIAKHSHFEAVWPFLQENWSVVWMDEYHHGYREQPSIFALYPGWLIAGFAQLGLLLLIGIWWRGKRFGPIYTLREWTVRRGDETLLAVASWYERRRLALDALRHREAYLRQMLYERWGIQQRADLHEIVSMARSKWSIRDSEQMASVLHRLEQAKSGMKYTPKQLLADSLLLDEIIKRLEKE